MTKYAATVEIYLNLDSVILDTATKIALTKIVARGIVRDRVPDDIVLRVREQVFTQESAGSLVPTEILAMQLAAQATGEAMLCPREGVLDLIHEWACHMSEQDPVAYDKIPRMNLADLWSTANAWHVARENAAIEAELLAIRTAPIRLIECPVLHTYDDGWKWVHVAGEAALRAEGDAMGHCVGNRILTSLTGSRAVLSLRDPEAMPHVTASMCGDHLMTAKGRSNSTPTKYWQQVNDMVLHVGAYLQTHADMGWADDELAEKVKDAKAARIAAAAEAAAAKLLADDAEGLRYAAPVDIETWAVANGLLDDGGGELPGFMVGRWRPVSFRIDAFPADPEAMIRTHAVHGVYAGQGTRGGAFPAWAAHAQDAPPFFNPNLSMAYDPSALAPDDCAPAADGVPKP